MTDPTEVRVQNCEVWFSYKCPKRWAALTPTQADDVRHCATCNKPVTRCTTPEQVESFTRMNPGGCMAYAPSVFVEEVVGQRDMTRMRALEASQVLRKHKHPGRLEKLRSFIDSI